MSDTTTLLIWSQLDGEEPTLAGIVTGLGNALGRIALITMSYSDVTPVTDSQHVLEYDCWTASGRYHMRVWAQAADPD